MEPRKPRSSQNFHARPMLVKPSSHPYPGKYHWQGALDLVKAKLELIHSTPLTGGLL